MSHKKVVFQPSQRDLWQQFDDVQLHDVAERMAGMKIQPGVDRSLLIKVIEKSRELDAKKI